MSDPNLKKEPGVEGIEPVLHPHDPIPVPVPSPIKPAQVSEDEVSSSTILEEPLELLNLTEAILHWLTLLIFHSTG